MQLILTVTRTRYHEALGFKDPKKHEWQE
jgi:hypothetical protein